MWQTDMLTPPFHASVPTSECSTVCLYFDSSVTLKSVLANCLWVGVCSFWEKTLSALFPLALFMPQPCSRGKHSRWLRTPRRRDTEKQTTGALPIPATYTPYACREWRAMLQNEAQQRPEHQPALRDPEEVVIKVLRFKPEFLSSLWYNKS